MRRFRNGNKKARQRTGGPKGCYNKLLEGELAAEDNAADNARVLSRIAEASEGPSEAGIFNDGINRGEIGVIEHIQECGPEFEIGMFAQLDVLKDGGIANV